MNTNIYLSGRFTVDAKIEADWLKRTGCKYRCFSYAFIDKGNGLQYNKRVEAALHVCEKKKINIMLDSGAHSLHVIARSSSKRGAHAQKKQKMDINELRKQLFQQYCKYVHKNKHLWKFYVTLDFKREQPVIYQMQKDFEKEGLAPTPVYHGDSSIEWLQKHKDMGHDFVCIGGATIHPGKQGLKYYFDQVFNFGAKHNMTFHGLAFTSLNILMSWPWSSVDSSTWSRTAAFGMIILPDIRRRKFFNVHVSDKGTSNPNTHHNMSKKQREALRAQLAAHGFDLGEMHTSDLKRHDWNGYVMSNLDKFSVTQEDKKVWENLI